MIRYMPSAVLLFAAFAYAFRALFGNDPPFFVFAGAAISVTLALCASLLFLTVNLSEETQMNTPSKPAPPQITVMREDATAVPARSGVTAAEYVVQISGLVSGLKQTLDRLENDIHAAEGTHPGNLARPFEVAVARRHLDDCGTAAVLLCGRLRRAQR